MTAQNILSISDEYAVSDLRFAKERSDAVQGLFFCHVNFSNSDVVEALLALSDENYQQVELFNCKGDKLHLVIHHLMTKIEVDTLTLEYTEFESPCFQDVEANAIGDALEQNSSVKSLCLKGLTRFPALGDALKRGLPRSKVKHFQWTNGLYESMRLQGDVENVEARSHQDADDEFWTALIAGLRNCVVLQRLEFRFIETDSLIARLLASLHRHPSLSQIVFTIKTFGEEINSGIDCLILGPVADRETDVGDIVNEVPLQTIEISIRGDIRRLPTLPNPRQKKIKYVMWLYFSSDGQMDALGEGLHRNSAIDEVHVLYHSVTCQGLRTLSSWLGRRQTKLRKLYMEGRPVQSFGALALLEVIQEQPSSLETVRLPRGTVHAAQIQHFADLNRAGWGKMVRNEENSSRNLALWPYVIERASILILGNRSKKENETRRANVVFHLVRWHAALHRNKNGENETAGISHPFNDSLLCKV